MLRCATKPPPDVAEQKRVDIPLEWRQLHLNLNDVLLDQVIYPLPLRRRMHANARGPMQRTP